MDIDALRVQLGRWNEYPESKHLARALGFSLARHHLASGYDVVLPQLTVRHDLVDQISQIAEDAGAEFIEVVLTASPAELRSRLEWSSTTDGHPRALFSLDELVDQIDHALVALRALASTRRDATLIDLSRADLGSAIAAVREAVA